MAVVGKQITVGTTATKLNSDIRPGDPIVGSTLLVTAGSVSLFLGDGTVTATGGTRGYELASGVSLPLDLGRGEDLFAAVASGTSTVDVLEVGV